MGIDLGTRGARCVIVDEEDGTVVAQGKSPITQINLSENEGWSEQDPAEWDRCLRESISQATSQIDAKKIRGIGITSTSGTIVPLGANLKPLHNAILHNDVRAACQAERLAEVTERGWSPSFALPKILWLKDERPEIYRETHVFCHATDYVAGFLTGEYSVSDPASALKTGYDIRANEWPQALLDSTGIGVELLPRVVPTGAKIGNVTEQAAETCGLERETPVFAGATDSNAAFLASGATKPGEWNTTIGSSLAFKGLSDKPIDDPNGLMYIHRHPDGLWLPGAATNAGAEYLPAALGNDYVAKAIYEDSDAALCRVPTDVLVFPLARTGERFPFNSSSAKGWIEGPAGDRLDQLAAIYQGLAFFERGCFRYFKSLGYEIGGKNYATGGGARLDALNQIRADILHTPVLKPSCPESAFGAAIIASAAVNQVSFGTTAKRMVEIEKEYFPREENAEEFAALYEKFRSRMRESGYEFG